MLSLSPQSFIQWLQQLPPEALTIVLFLVCGLVILLMMRFFGALGLIVYSIIAVIVSNLQVQTATQYSFFTEPIALGTIVFSSLFFVSGMMTEYYGKREAQRAVWLSFISMILVTIIMLITTGFKPSIGFEEAHKAMCTLFIPAPAIIVASLIAYVLGQLNDIWIFGTLSRLTQTKLLWLRSLVATLIGSFLDNLIFSVLAWIVFAPTPLSWNTVIFTYVIGGYLIRVFVAFAGIPFVYIARYMVK
jgi:hypothetical protein